MTLTAGPWDLDQIIALELTSFVYLAREISNFVIEFGIKETGVIIDSRSPTTDNYAIRLLFKKTKNSDISHKSI